MCKSTEPVLFADDTNMILSGSNDSSLKDWVNNDLVIITKWLKVNKIITECKENTFHVFQLKTGIVHAYLYGLT